MGHETKTQTLFEAIRREFSEVKAMAWHGERWLSPELLDSFGERGVGISSEEKVEGLWGAASDLVPRFEVIVDSYNFRRVEMLVAELERWAHQEGLSLRPAVLQLDEVQLLREVSCPGGTPYEMMSWLRRETPDPYRLRKQMLSALDELMRMLNSMELEFPTAGFHAWTAGRKLSVIYTQLLHWTFALYERPYQKTPEDRKFFESLCGVGHVFSPKMRGYATHLQGFLERHRTLAMLLPRMYGENDLELERLCAPLRHAIRALRKETKARLQVPEVEERKKRLWLQWSGAVVALTLFALGWSYWSYHSSFLAPETTVMPTQKVGGIVGKYYKGRTLQKQLNQRVDRQLDMLWETSPLHKVPKDRFRVRWDGFLQAPEKGRFEVCLEFDDGARLTLGGEQVLEDWTVGAVRRRCFVRLMRAGWHKMTLDFFENYKVARIRLSWRRPGRPSFATVPSKHLCCKP